MKISKGLLFLLIFCLLFLQVSCSQKQQASTQTKEETLKIYTTFYPVYEFTKNITKNGSKVVNLTPAGVEPHDFEPSPKQIVEIYNADMFIYLGESMEPWAKKIAPELEGKGVLVVEAGKGLVENDDPHIWVDPILAQKMAERILNGIVAVDGQNAEKYRENFKILVQKLKEIDSSFLNLASCSVRKDIITSHGFMGYIAKRYGFNQVSIAGLSPQEEPSMKKMTQLIEYCKQNDVKYIFVEPGENSKTSETLATEIGAGILELHPLGTLWPQEIKEGKDYFSIMKDNIEVLKKALCAVD